MDELMARLDAGVAQYLSSLDAKPGEKDGASLDIAALRRAMGERRAHLQFALPDLFAVHEDWLGGRSGPIAVRRYLPRDLTGREEPAIVYFHGGGYVSGDLDSHDPVCRVLASTTGQQVIAVDYRLAPEHRFPAAVDDALDAYVMMRRKAWRWGIDPARIVVAGDSVGGSLAIVVSLHARDICIPMPCAQLLFYPVADLSRESGATDGFARRTLTRDQMRGFRSLYLVDGGVDAGDWRVSPLRADSLIGLPPTFLTVAGFDPLYEEGCDLADRLTQEGVRVDLRRLPGQIHGYLRLGRIVPEARASLDAAARFLAGVEIAPALSAGAFNRIAVAVPGKR